MVFSTGVRVFLPSCRTNFNHRVTEKLFSVTL